MPSISYDSIFSTVFSKASMYDFLNLTELQADEFLCNWLKSARSKPYVRKLFSSVSSNDDARVVTFTMSKSIDEESDVDFVTEVLALGVLYEWITPKVISAENIAQMFSNSDAKWYSQASHLAQIKDLRDSILKEQRSLISDRGYMWNSYLDGES